MGQEADRRLAHSSGTLWPQSSYEKLFAPTMRRSQAEDDLAGQPRKAIGRHFVIRGLYHLVLGRRRAARAHSRWMQGIGQSGWASLVADPRRSDTSHRLAPSREQPGSGGRALPPGDAPPLVGFNLLQPVRRLWRPLSCTSAAVSAL